MRASLRLVALLGTATALAAGPLTAAAAPPPAATYARANLVSDQPGVAAVTDPNLINPWGMSRGPTSPIWVSDNGTDVSTLYRGATGGTATQTVPLVVATPGGAPTGQVFNDTTAFAVPGTNAPALFVFAGEHGDITAWNQAATPVTSAVRVARTAGAVYKGITIAHSPFGPLLLAANFHSGRVDVFDGSFQRVQAGRLFRDPAIPAGYAPFNVAAVGDRVLVSYAQQDADREDDVPGDGHGFVDSFTTYGSFVHRLVSRGDLNSPWGLTLAPADFGVFSNDLLVGNFGDGLIHAYDPRTGAALGVLMGTRSKPVRIDGLWGLLAGDSVAGGANTLWFSAGPGGEAHGLLGILRPSPASA